MRFTPLAARRLVATYLLVVLSAGLGVMAAGCKRAATSPAHTQPSASGNGAQPSNAAQASAGNPSGRLADQIKALQSGIAQGGATSSSAPAAAAPLPDWKPAPATAAVQIPLIKGLVVDSSISSINGDLENIETIADINAASITKIGDDEHAPKTPGGHPQNLNGPPEATGTGTIVLDVADVASSNHLFPFFATGKTMHTPGALDRGVSTETLKQLRTGNLVNLQIATNFNALMAATLKGLVPPTVTQWGSIPVYQCNLQRAEPSDLALPVLVNNEPVELPVLHARCLLDNKDENDFYILDQLSNPIFLYTRLGKFGDSSQSIKITFETAAKKNSIEQKLADKEPVEIYGIYFDFNSAYIKPESEVVLKEIADVMRKNPGWKLSIAGHTDNIGGDAFNQTLSEARAAAVKAALVKEYGIAPDRLSTSGFGASKPIADNAKVEGRARNRRVELQRQ